jgi:hypothetical protein
LPLIPGPQSLTHNPLHNMMIQSKTNNHLSLILNHLYGLHSFAFYILIFNFPLQSLIPRPQSLIPNPSPLTPDPSPLPPNAIVHKYLRAEKLLYNCREDSTNIESSLQINLFMQNKANFQKVKLNVNQVLTKDYDRMDTWSIRKTKPIQSQSKPIQSQLKPIQSQLKPKQTQFKAKQTQFQSQYMLLLLTINGCRISFGHYAGNRQTIPTGSPDTPRLTPASIKA